MPVETAYSLASFSDVYQLQAGGIVDTGANYPSGIGDNLTVSGGVMRATVRDTDPETAVGLRSEIRPPSDTRTEKWYRWEFMIPADWDDAKAMSVAQIHDSPDGGDLARFPNFLLTIEGGLIVALLPNAALPTQDSAGKRVGFEKLIKNRWYSCCLHCSWQIGATGFREFILDGVPMFREWDVATHYDDVVGPYLKLGVYDFYHAGGFGTKTAYYRNIKAWSGNDGYQSVMGRLPTPRQTALCV